MSEITPGSDLREVADQVSAQARTFLSTVTQVASGGMPGAELSLLVLAASDLLAAGARLAAIVDVVPKERYEPDAGPDTDLDPLRVALSKMFDGFDDYTEVVDPVLGEDVGSASLSGDLACVAEEHGIGEAVDGEIGAGGEDGDHPREHWCDKLARRHPDLGRVGGVRHRLERRSLLGFGERHLHRHPRPLPGPSADFEAGRQGGDQRQSESQALAIAVGSRAEPAAVIGDGDDKRVALRGGLDLERADLVLIRMRDDVHARLRDDDLEVVDTGRVHVERLGQTGDGVADDGDVLRPREDREP